MNQDQEPVIKVVINYLAALLGIGSFLGFVNLVVGLLSAGWIAIQIYGYLTHEIPMKKIKKKKMALELQEAEILLRSKQRQLEG